jgi:hypothetical protein
MTREQGPQLKIIRALLALFGLGAASVGAQAAPVKPYIVFIMPTVLVLAGGKPDPAYPLDGRNLWPTLADGKPSPNEDILINVEAFRGAVRKGD